MPTPTISVIVPVYGVELYIEACLRSIAAQTFRDFELILVDDGCLDNSIPLAEQYLRTTDLHWRIIHQENAGLSMARQAGIDAALGEWLSFIDSDDTVAPSFLETLYRLTQTYHTEVALVSFQYVSQTTAPTPVSADPGRILSQQEALSGFLTRSLIPLLPAFLLRRRFLSDHRIQSAENCRFSEDMYYMWQIFFAAEKIAVCDTPLYFYFLHSGSIMTASSPEKLLSGYDANKELLDNHPQWFRTFPKAVLILPRWVLGALNTAARISSFSVFLDFAKELDYRSYMKKLLHFPEYRARILAMLLLLSPKLYYALLHRSAIQ